MGWTKPHKKPYYYRSYRLNGRVVNEYVKSSPELAQSLQQQAAARAAERAALESYDKFIQTYDYIQDYLKLLTTATLLVNGYHRHKNQWRKKRVKTLRQKSETQTTNHAPPQPTCPAAPYPNAGDPRQSTETRRGNADAC